MLFRLIPFALFGSTVLALVWNAWLRDPPSGDSTARQPWLPIYFSVAALLGALFVILFHEFTPHERYWAYATLGIVIGFWMRR